MVKLNPIVLKGLLVEQTQARTDRRRFIARVIGASVGMSTLLGAQAIFAQGIPRPTSPTRKKTVYIDGSSTVSGDGNSPLSPLRDLTQRTVFRDTQLLFRRGTSVTLIASLRIADCSMGFWGEAATAPEIRVESDQGVGVDCVEGYCWIEGISLTGGATAKRRTNGIDATEASRLVVIQCGIRGFFNGIKFCGDDGWIQGNTIADVANNGIFGGRHGKPAPSRTTVIDNVIDATGARNDGITLHDGTGVGLGNVLVGNRISGAHENGIDVQPPYQQTVIERNLISGTSEYAILVAQKDTADGGRGTRILNNEITSGSAAGIYVFASGVDVIGNRISGILSTKGANAFLIAGDCNVTDNVVDVPEGNMRPVITIAPRPGTGALALRFEGNKISNASIQPMLHLARTKSPGDPARVDARFARNRYAAATAEGARFDGKRFEEWRSVGKLGQGFDVQDDAAPGALPPRR